MYEFNCGYCKQEITMDHAWMLSFSKDEVHLDCNDPYGYLLTETLDSSE